MLRIPYVLATIMAHCTRDCDKHHIWVITFNSPVNLVKQVFPKDIKGPAQGLVVIKGEAGLRAHVTELSAAHYAPPSMVALFGEADPEIKRRRAAQGRKAASRWERKPHQ